MWRGRPRPRVCLLVSLGPANDLVRYTSRHLFIAREVHGVFGAALCARAHVCRVAKHLRQRNDGLDHLRTGSMFHALDASATRTEVAHDDAGIIFRGLYFDRHHWLQQHRRGLARGFFKCHRTRNLESHFIRIHIVIAAIVENGLHVDHLVAGEDAAFHGLPNTLVDRLDEFLGHRATHDIVDKLVSLAWLLRLQEYFGVTVLTAAASLTNVLAFSFGFLADCLAIGHLRLAHICFDLVLADHAVDDDFEMQFAHAADNGLTAVRVGVDFESRVFLGEASQRHAHLFLIGFGLR